MDEVWFSPGGGVRAEVIRILRGAKKSVLVRGYEFTSEPIANALVEAQARGVAVEVILDRRVNLTGRSSQATRLHAGGIAVFLDGLHNIAHSKVMVMDDGLVLTGSYNWTDNAELHNAENLVALHDHTLVAAYTADHVLHRAHSVPWATARLPLAAAAWAPAGAPLSLDEALTLLPPGDVIPVAQIGPFGLFRRNELWTRDRAVTWLTAAPRSVRLADDWGDAQGYSLMANAGMLRRLYIGRGPIQ